MPDPIRLSDARGRRLAFALVAFAFTAMQVLPAPLLYAGDALAIQSVDEGKVKKSHQSFFADIFDQALYEEGVQFLRLGELGRKLVGAEIRAKNVNVYEEVPDSLFFTNRHGRNRLSKSELEAGPGVEPPQAGKWTVTRGKMEGVNPGFFIRDSAGREFLLKFDPIDNIELASAAESITARLFHAIGYNVPSYHVVNFKLDDLEVDPAAKYYDDTGFKKSLSRDRVEEQLLFVAKLPDDSVRASASGLLQGNILGPFHLDGKRRHDPNSHVPHRYLREIRALRVFCSWANYYDIRTGNTLDVLQEIDGKKAIRHYIIDFGSTLGSAGVDPHPPMFGYEYVFDFGEFWKSIFTFGFRKKPWQKRKDEQEGKSSFPSTGNFDNLHFDPVKWKNQMPYHAFKDLTAADGYWAAKIVMSFTDEDIEVLVGTGQLSDPEAGDYLRKVLSERRDIIARYWFGKNVPLDWFEISREAAGFKIAFTDLTKYYGLDESPVQYRYKVKGTSIRGETGEPAIQMEESQISGLGGRFTVVLQARRGSGKWGKHLCLHLDQSSGELKLAGIRREL